MIYKKKSNSARSRTKSHFDLSAFGKPSSLANDRSFREGSRNYATYLVIKSSSRSESREKVKPLCVCFEMEAGDIGNFSGPGLNMTAGQPVLKTIHDYLLVILLVAVMFAMGCHITWEELWTHIRRPIGIIIGMVSQFVLLPLSGFIMIKVLGFGILHATGLLILSASPGGVTSNMFTYFCEGDISLSIAMTTCSTLVAMGMMPLNLYMYGQNLNHENIVIPYLKMALSLISVTCPVLIGMLVHWKFPRVAAYLTKIGSYAGILIILICQTLEYFIFPNIFRNVPVQLYVAVVILPCLGFALGYTSAWICRQRPEVRRTISIESGVQNVGTALTVASLSFPFHNLEKVLLFPWLYAFSMTAVCIVISAFYQLYIRKCGKTKSVETLPTDREVSTVRYAEEGGNANIAYVADSTKM